MIVLNQVYSPSLFETLSDLFLVCDETGAVLDWNQAVVDVAGYTDEELPTMALTDLVADLDADRIETAVETVQQTGEATVDVQLRTADGNRLAYEFELHQLPDDDELDEALGADSGDGTAAFVAVGREGPSLDLDVVLDRMSDAFFAVDSQWQITYANEMAERILSEAIERDLGDRQLKGLHLWDEVPEAVDTVFYDKYHEAMATQEPVTFEEYYLPLDRWFDVRVYPSESGLSIYLYDVTDRHREHEALKHREQVLREMYDIIADRSRSFTEQVEALLELGRTELDTAYGSLSKIEGEDYIFEIVDSDDDSIEAGDVVPLSATNCELAASTKETLVLGDVARDAPEETDRAGYTEWGIACYIGGPVFVEDEVYGTFCFYDTEPRDGQFLEWEVTLVDLMSRWVGYELQRTQANDRLQRQNEKLEQFASIVSHDLRNPLNVLEGRLELAEETGDAEQFDHCYDAIDRMNALIDSLLTLARAGDAIEETEGVPLGSLVERCWEGVATGAATRRIETDRTIEADETRLQQLLENLIRNSVEHSSTGSRSETDDSVDHGSDAVTVTVGDLPDGFYVEDDGPGIPEDEREAVFESGYSDSPDGTGFGLAIVREIAAAHGWDVSLTESDGGGARFEFTGVTVHE